MISLIVAMTSNRVIGNKGKIPWFIKDDMANFKRITTGNIVVMGRATFESLPMTGGLPNRTNIVLTREPEKFTEQASQTLSFVSGITQQELRELSEKTGKEVFIIGGANIYEQFFPMVDKAYLSIIKCCCEGDTKFPDVDWYEWRKSTDVEYPEYFYRVMHRV